MENDERSLFLPNRRKIKKLLKKQIKHVNKDIQGFGKIWYKCGNLQFYIKSLFNLYTTENTTTLHAAISIKRDKNMIYVFLK